MAEKKSKMHKNVQKMGKFLPFYEESTLIRATIARMKGLKYALHSVKCASFT